MTHLVEMHKKYAKDGLEIVSVSTDEIEPGKGEDVKQRVLKVLRGKSAAFTNVILDEPAEFIQEKLHYVLSPCMFVFNRDGKWTQFNSDDGNKIDYAVVEKLVVESLKAAK